MFEKYNAVLRAFTKVPFLESKSQTLCQGNLYTTTLHCINSSVVKLGKLTVARPVYRGIAGGLLPAVGQRVNVLSV